MKKSSSLEIKHKIYDLIVKNPGLHASQIAELLEISWELVYYHILYLEKNGLINIVKKDGYSRCFATGAVGENDRNILSILRQKKPLIIILFLLSSPHSRFKEIAAGVDFPPSVLAYHIEKLVKKDILKFEVVKNTKRYFVRDRKYIIQLLIRYRPQSLIDDYEEIQSSFFWTKDLFKNF